MGEKQSCADFQDAIMIQLLGCINGDATTIETVKAGVMITNAGSVMRRLLAETAVFLLHKKKSITTQDLKQCEGANGFITEVADALGQWKDKGSTMFSDRTREAKADKPAWKQFMVGTA